MAKKAARRSSHQTATRNEFKEIARRVRQDRLWQKKFNEMVKPSINQDLQTEPHQAAAPGFAGVLSLSLNPSGESFTQQYDHTDIRTK